MKDGFKFEISRSHEFDATKRIPLQWVDGKNFDEAAMLNNRKHKIDNEPVCAFEASVHKVKAPERSLNPVDERVRFQLAFITYSLILDASTYLMVIRCLKALVGPHYGVLDRRYQLTEVI